jgi:hypothetical protein
LGNFSSVEQAAELSTFEVIEVQPGEGTGLGGKHIAPRNETFGESIVRHRRRWAGRLLFGSRFAFSHGAGFEVASGRAFGTRAASARWHARWIEQRRLVASRGRGQMKARGKS